MLVTEFSPTALFPLLAKILLFGRSFGTGGIFLFKQFYSQTNNHLAEVGFLERFVKNDLRTGFVVSGFYLPETTATDLSREESTFSISFFRYDNNRVDPGKPVFSVGEKKENNTKRQQSC